MLISLYLGNNGYEIVADERTRRKNAYVAEVANNLFVGIERALKPNAPLLLNKFKKDYPQAGAYARYHDGQRDWEALEAMGHAGAQLAGEAASYDAQYNRVQGHLPRPKGRGISLSGKDMEM